MVDTGNKTDAEMSMAIDNLSAILGLDDVDKVIQLLQQNKWDESAAAQQYYAQEAQQQMNQRPAAAAGLNHSIQTDQDEYERENGVRRPIDFQQEQLVGGGGDESVGLLGVTSNQMMQMQMMQRMQQQRMMGQQPLETPVNRGGARMLQRGLPERAPQLTYENLADTSEDRVASGNAAEEVDPGVARRFYRGVRSAFTSAFSWCNSEEDELQNLERASADTLQIFRTKFEDQYQEAVGQPSRLTLFAESFQRLCVSSRRDKKPILVLVTRTNQDECFRQALTALTQAEAARDLIRERFIFAGFSLESPPLEQLGQLISLGNAEAALYFIVVQHDAKVQMLRKLNLSVQTTGAQLYDYVSETANLFTIMAEEDPGYLQQEVLQNAGILPVEPAQQRRQSQQRPQSRQADPDVLLREKQRREYEEAQVQDQMRQIERQEQEMKENSERAAQQQAEELKQEENELSQAIEFERKERAKWLNERMPEEPEAGGSDIAEVVLRAQGSGKRFTRRFLKTDKVSILYMYVRTLAEEDLGFDDSNAQFQICQPFPRKTFTEDAEQTLEELGLFPRAALQIQEVTAD